MMTGKSVKDVDRYQAVLNSLLALEENKFCADCESKGPRWASWNLGIFICIRCAGIHRNLGVHISKVKSVNLDQWTQEQVQCVQEMGNAKARRLYEAFLPECFQRPETDQSAEAFIRDKYDRKKYIDKVIDIQMLRKEKSCDNIPKEPVVFEKMKLKKEVSPKTDPQAVTDLLGLDAPAVGPAVANGAGCGPDTNQSPATGGAAMDLFSPLPLASSSSSCRSTPVSSCLPQCRVTASVPENLSLFLDPAAPRTGPVEGGVRKLSKDSILSLYGSTPSVHTAAAAAIGAPHAGLYMNQMGYLTHPYGSYHSLAQVGGMVGGAMMTSQMAMMGQQQQQQQQQQLALHHSGAMGGPYMAHSMMGHQQSMMVQQQQVGAPPLLQQQQQQQQQQQVFGGQQLQWNVGQMSQQMAGMNLFSANGTLGYGSQHAGGSAAPPSSAHMSAHVWK